MDNLAADARYDVTYRPAWGAEVEPIGHLVIRRLDDREVVAEVPIDSEEHARSLLARAESDVRGRAADFEAAWGISPPSVDDEPVPTVSVPP